MRAAFFLSFLMACGPPGSSGPSAIGLPDVPDEVVDPDEPVDLGEPDEEVDVLVVGAGPAGLAAVDAAVGAGASVRVYERSDQLGGNGPYASRYYAVGSKYQMAAGIEDTVEAALDDWETLTLGGDPSDPRVIRLVERSAEVVEWAVETLGAKLFFVGPDLEFEMTPRQHALATGSGSPATKLASLYGDRVITRREARGVVVEQGRVVGVTWVDLDTGATGWARARGGVVVAAGGFGRSLERVLALHPEVVGVLSHVEIGPTSVGASVPWVEAAGAARQDRPGIGFFVHSVADPREGRAGEVLWMPSAHRMLYVNADGRRVANEYEATGFRLVETLLAQETPRLFAFAPRSATPRLEVPPYNVSEGLTNLTLDQAAEMGAIVIADSTAECALALGVDPDGLWGTVVAYNDISVTGSDPEFGKRAADAPPIIDAPGAVICAEMVVAASKSYTGFASDYDQHLIAADGLPIEGLYGAGEFVGMLGSSGMGGGASGTMTAVLLTGRIAGENAARDAHP